MCKQAIVVRKDLKMGKGKLAAQVAHASLLAYKKALQKTPEIVKLWEKSGMAKIVLKVDSLEELMKLYNKIRHSLPCALVRDAGRTQLKEGTVTCFACGPAKSEKIDKFLRHLKLL